MYDVSENYAAHQRLWQAVCDLVTEAPPLTNPSNDLISDWLSPDLFFSQTCSLPFRKKLRGFVNLIATPDNKISNCPRGYYHSVVLARKGSTPDLKKMTLSWHIMSHCPSQVGLLHSRLELWVNPNCRLEATLHLQDR